MVHIIAEEWDLLGLYWKGTYYIDTCLPFGLRSAPHIFDHSAVSGEVVVLVLFVKEPDECP